MAISKEEKEFANYVVDLMQTIGPVRAKSMFGGHGLFLDGLMFALIADCVLYLKVDNESEIDFQARGLQPFTYMKMDKEYKMSYYQAPEEALDNAEEMNHWANQAYSVALKAASNKNKKGKKASVQN